MSEAVLESQDEVIIRKPKRQETECDNDKQSLDDILLGLGYNDMYIK